MKRLCCAVTAFLIAAYGHAAPLDHGDLVTFPTRVGVTQSLFIESPSPNPPMIVILYSGGDGTTRLDQSGATNQHGNFIVRTAHFWVQHGYAAVLTDAPSDMQRDGMNDYWRRSKDTLVDQKEIIAQVRQRFGCHSPSRHLRPRRAGAIPQQGADRLQQERRLPRGALCWRQTSGLAQ